MTVPPPVLPSSIPAALAALPELRDGAGGMDLDDSTPGFLAYNRTAPVFTVGTSSLTGTTVETTVATVELGALTVADLLALIVAGTVVQNTGADRTLTLRLKLDGTTIATWVATIPAAAGTRSWQLDMAAVFFTFAGTQTVTSGRLTIGGLAGAADLGTWTLAPASTAVDLATPNLLSLTIKNDVAGMTTATGARPFVVVRRGV